MPLFINARSFLRSLFRSRHIEADLQDEVRSHLQMLTDEHLRSGLSQEQARRAARIELGGVEQVKEQVREQRLGNWLHSMFSDCRFAIRQLRKSRGFTAVATLTLALGIGANTAIFTVVDSALLRSLPFPRASGLVYLHARSTVFDFPYLGLSLPDVQDIRTNASSFAATSAYEDSAKELFSNGKPQRIECSEVTENFFPILGLRPLYGRTFTSEDMQAGSRVVLLSYPLWRESFGSDPSVIGKTITLDGEPHIVIGVMPDQPPLDFATDSKLWTPFVPTKEQLTDRSNHAYQVLARLQPHANIKAAQNELDTLSARLAQAYPDADKGWSIHATSLKQFLLGDARAPLAILFCAVGFVLLIACANVSNLSLARCWARRREFAIRSAIGASRGDLLRQLVVESLLLAFAGGAGALLMATWSIHALRSVLPPDLPRLEQLRIDSLVVAFTVGASLIAALLAGLAPAFLSTRQSSGADAFEQLKQSVATRGSGHDLLRRTLVVSEVALATILLIGATLAVRSFTQLLRLDLGFRPDHLIALRLDFPKFRFTTSSQAITFVQQVLESTRATPSVVSASAGLVFPMSDEVGETTFQTDATISSLVRQSALGNRVAPEFFHTLGIPVLAGREFTNSDTTGKAPVFIVNETLARRYFGTINAAGKRLSNESSSGKPVWGEIVGVVGDVREGSVRDDSKPQLYAPFYQANDVAGIYLLVRGNTDSRSLVPVLQDRIWSLDKTQPVTSVATLDERITQVNASPRSQTLLLGTFAALGFLLALVGVYGVISYVVSLQTREIGVRMALGAAPSQVQHLVLGLGMKLTISGVIAGIACGFALTRFMRSLLFGISSFDPLTYAGVGILLTAIATAACYFPARRASRVDPMVALRYE
jgi:predicted permease